MSIHPVIGKGLRRLLFDHQIPIYCGLMCKGFLTLQECTPQVSPLRFRTSQSDPLPQIQASLASPGDPALPTTPVGQYATITLLCRKARLGRQGAAGKARRADRGLTGLRPVTVLSAGFRPHQGPCTPFAPLCWGPRLAKGVAGVGGGWSGGAAGDSPVNPTETLPSPRPGDASPAGFVARLRLVADGYTPQKGK
jgi:hypothetical protein